jgi:E3 ubiquitin-protein ligase RNF5
MEKEAESRKEERDERLKQFECKICLEVASEPVVTTCGHLFW